MRRVKSFHTDRHNEANSCCENAPKNIKNYVRSVKWNVVKIVNTLRDFMTVYRNSVSVIVVRYEMQISARNFITRYRGQ
jgi:hypothetical protein